MKLRQFISVVLLLLFIGVQTGKAQEIVNGKIVWHGSTLTEALEASETGFVYLYNVEQDKFLNAGNAYGVQCSLSAVGMRLKVHQVTYKGNTYYQLESRIDNQIQGDYVSPNEQTLANDKAIYLDRSSEPHVGIYISYPNWAFDDQRQSGYNTYKIHGIDYGTLNGIEKYGNGYRNITANVNASSYYMGSNDGSTVVYVGQNGSNNTWRFVTEADYEAAMAKLEWGEIDMNAFIKDAEFTRNSKDSVYWEWKYANGAPSNTVNIDGENKTIYGDGPYFSNNQIISNPTHWHLRGQQWMDNGTINFRNGGNELNGKYFVAEIYNEENSLSQTAKITSNSPLKPGLYKITCQGFYHDGNRGTTNSNSSGTGAVAYFTVIRTSEDGTRVVERTPLMPMADGSKASQITPRSGISAGKVLLENPDEYLNTVFIEVTEGATLTLMLEQTEAAGGWSVMDNFRFYACGVMAMYNSEDWENRNYTFKDNANGHEFTGNPYVAFEYPAKYEYPATLYLQRTLSKKKWNTIILPVNLSGSQIRQAFGEDAKVSKLTACTDTRIIFSEPANLWTEGMLAGVPYIIKPTKDPGVAAGDSVEARVGNGEAHTITIAGPLYSILGVTKTTEGLDTDGNPATIHPITVTSESGKSTVTMKGTFYASNSVMDMNRNDNYIIYQGTMYHLKSNKWIFATYCWLESPKSSTGGAKEMKMYIGDEDVTTAIEGLSFTTDDVVTSQDVIYNINGQRLGSNSLQKGIYIKNGKKFIVK